MRNINELLQIAIDETANIVPGEKFLLKDLFKGYEWNRILRKDRLLLGTLFLNFVNSKDNDKGISTIEKTSSNQQKYQKVNSIKEKL